MPRLCIGPAHQQCETGGQQLAPAKVFPTGLARSGSKLSRRNWGECTCHSGTILIIILILILLGVIPTWGHSRGWGYGPSGIVGLILIILS